MDGIRLALVRLSNWINHQLIWFVLGSYAVAAVWPGFGLWIRDLNLGEYDLLHDETLVTLPMVMLALLLFNAGLGARPSQLRQLFRNPLLLVAGLVANLVIPVAFILVVTLGLRVWHNPDEVQNILVGLALVASMPIAGSSTAWSQNTNGNVALSLGLVLASTVLSPLTTPVALHAIGWLAQGEYAAQLHNLAAYGTGAFLILCVVVPSLLGVFAAWMIGEKRLAPARPYLKLVNSINLLLLGYSNAAVSLPQAVAEPDYDFLMVTLTIVVLLCAVAFSSGWSIGRWLGADGPSQASLMYGLGMNNNGTGLVLASMTLAAHPRILLPIIFYNLVQHVGAGVTDFLLSRPYPPLAGPVSRRALAESHHR